MKPPLIGGVRSSRSRCFGCLLGVLTEATVSGDTPGGVEARTPKLIPMHAPVDTQLERFDCERTPSSLQCTHQKDSTANPSPRRSRSPALKNKRKKRE